MRIIKEYLLIYLRLKLIKGCLTGHIFIDLMHTAVTKETLTCQIMGSRLNVNRFKTRFFKLKGFFLKCFLFLD